MAARRRSTRSPFIESAVRKEIARQGTTEGRRMREDVLREDYQTPGPIGAHISFARRCRRLKRPSLAGVSQAVELASSKIAAAIRQEELRCLAAGFGHEPPTAAAIGSFTRLSRP